MTRKYELKRRAERQAATRQRIVEATVALHESVGGAGATISAIAERAGVERLTVYRHFPDARALTTACTQHYWAVNPPPDPGPWPAIADPEARLRAALSAIYAYHRRTERMSLRTAQELPQYPLLREILAPQFAYWSEVQAVLAVGWVSDGATPRLVQAAIEHAIGFLPWHTLVSEQGLADAEVIELMVGMLRCLACQSREAG